MYIVFDPNNVRFQRVKFKGATTALGGSVRILDEPHFKKTKEEKFIKIEAPMALVRAFLIKHHQPKFFRPTEGAIAYYNNRVISLELAPMHCENQRIVKGVDGRDMEWMIEAEMNFRQLIQPGMREGRWFFDGIYAYTFDDMDFNRVARQGTKLSSDGRFRNVRCRALNLTRLSASEMSLGIHRGRSGDVNVGTVEDRSCLGMVVSDELSVITPPIWKQLSETSSARRTRGDIDDQEDGVFSANAMFDTLNDKVFVNLAFALSAAKEITIAFGYDSIGPLQLPDLMVQLRTVNLPRVVKEIKTTHDIGMPFTHGLAWLIGLLHRAQTEEQVNAVRRMMKYLTTKGIYVRARMSGAAIHKNEHKEADVPLLSPVEALKNFDSISKQQWQTIMMRAGFKSREVDILDIQS